MVLVGGGGGGVMLCMYVVYLFEVNSVFIFAAPKFGISKIEGLSSTSFPVVLTSSLLSFLGVVGVVTQRFSLRSCSLGEKRCVTTLVTAARETTC